jgi:epsilon-lactone hydrolase
MTNGNSYSPLSTPAREIPVPTTPSAQAQAVLAAPIPGNGQTWKLGDDKATIQAAIDMVAASVPTGQAGPMLAGIYGTADTGVVADVELIDVDGVPVYVATPEGLDPSDRRVYLAIHGAWIHGGGEMARMGAAITAGGLGARTWVVDYRMPPYHPFPAPLDDCLAVYRRLLQDHSPEEIIIGGMSAGANMTLATILRARDEGLPLPAAAVVNSPPADLTASGDSVQTNAYVDVSFTLDSLDDIFSLYAEGHDRLDPYLSPVFGDFSKGFPPTLLTSGTRDFLLSDTVRVHRKLRAAGVEAELHVWEAAPHFMFLGMAPEDHERTAEVARFVHQQWSAAAIKGLQDSIK